MALPQQVIDRLTKESPATQGWSFGLFTFSGGLLALMVIVYLGLTLGYEPYIDSQLTQVNAQITTLGRSVSAGDQSKLITFYSELANLKTVLAGHVTTSRFFSWLEKNTEANIWYTHFVLDSNNQISLTGSSKNENDISQQIAIFEADPSVSNLKLSNVTFSDSDHVWNFTVAFNVDQAALLQPATQ